MERDLDLLELLTADHENLRAHIGDEMFGEHLAKHLHLERALLYPLIEREMPNHESALSDIRTSDRELEQTAFEQPDAAQGSLEEHINSQIALFDEVRLALPEDILVELSEQVPLLLAEAPTHAHPHLPDHGPFREISTEIVASMDHLKDRFRQKK